MTDLDRTILFGFFILVAFGLWLIGRLLADIHSHVSRIEDMLEDSTLPATVKDRADKLREEVRKYLKK